MVRKPLVSIIIPFYDQAEYLQETVASALGQTYSDCELVVIDDASPAPDAEALLTTYRSNRLRIERNARNIGAAASRNKGIELASGELILPLDADDLILPEYLEKTVNLLISDPKIAGVYTNVYQFGECEISWQPVISPAHLLCGQGSPVTMLMRRDVFTATGGYKPHLREGENSELILSALELGLRFAHIPEELFHYRRHRREQTRQSDFISKSVANLVREHRQLALDNLFEILVLQYELRNDLVEKQRKLHDYCQNVFESHTADPLLKAIRNSRLKEKGMQDFPPPPL
jgi:glycosyltransferase involved in cell wall biosynthesis